MALVAVQMVQCDGCRGMLMDISGDDTETITTDINKATIFRTPQAAATRANMRGWRIWTSWREDGSEYVSRVDCPKDRT